MGLEIDLSDFMWLPELFHRRQNLAQDLMQEGRVFTDTYIASGGRYRANPKTLQRPHPTMRRRILRQRSATGQMYARGVEIVSYHKFHNWWDRSW